MEGGGGEVMKTTPDKCSKRDEWSEGGVMSLLDVYESKWVLRNRAKLKGSDWEEIAQTVSVRNSGTKAVKTPNQCKNKIESMKKRYRAESSVNNNLGSGSSWHFFARMDGLVKGTQFLQSKGEDGFVNGLVEAGSRALPKVVDDSENDLKRVNETGPDQAHVVEEVRNCEAVDVEAQDHIQDSNHEDGSNTVPDNGEFSTPRNKIGNAGDGLRKISPFKRRKSLGSDVAESIRLLAHSILKIEQARMEMYKDSERLRVEAEIKRAEMELKRTEIIAKTQLQIVKLFVERPRNQNNKSGSTSLRAEQIFTTEAEENNG